MNERDTTLIACPCCNNREYSHWVTENGFHAVKCKRCGFIYVNPRPADDLISDAVKTGVHREVANNAIARRLPAKVNAYRRIFRAVFSDVWRSEEDISWLDIGAGYGEVVEAISSIATDGSKIEGIEPMTPKATDARSRGLAVHEMFLKEVSTTYDFVSLINVFSHVPDFHSFLREINGVLSERGELFIETGDIGGLSDASQFPFEWNLPDHLVFASEENLRSFLSTGGFEVLSIDKRRIDGFVEFSKNAVKKILGRRVVLRFPYTTPHRTMLVRARKTG